MGTMERIRWSLPLSTRHPAGHGGPLFDLTVDEAVVVDAEVVPGRLHRGAEKLFESRDYRAVLALANRHDWLGSFGSELSLAQLLEASLGIAVPARAAWLRTLLAEATRISHHLLWLAASAEEFIAPGAGRVGLAARRDVVDRLEEYTGVRMHPTVVRIGGLRADCEASWPAAMVTSTADAVQIAADLAADLTDPAAGMVGLAVLTPEDAWDFATSGPVARASGVALDLRLDRPDECYGALADAGQLTAVVRGDGDAATRFEVLAAQVAVSAACVQGCAQQLAELTGPVQVPLPRSIRVPEGTAYHAGENPGGINGWLLVSRGGPMPYRLKLRTSSYNNAAALAAALPGTELASLPAAVSSFFLLAGDIDK